jgi:branched-subunit amino acid aminotransferase/4-amino-4-deoxychorismate lyase
MILSGITRKNVLRIAAKSGFRIIERAVKQHDISTVSEAFLTNTSSEITPVTELGGIRIGPGLPGPVTRLLQQIFRSETSALKG